MIYVSRELLGNLVFQVFKVSDPCRQIDVVKTLRIFGNIFKIRDIHNK